MTVRSSYVTPRMLTQTIFKINIQFVQTIIACVILFAWKPAEIYFKKEPNLFEWVIVDTPISVFIIYGYWLYLGILLSW